ncbi:MAG: chromosome segregation protein SMC, partial [Acidimicrobiales bacterium]|nr:chromosome segregation protein SMC [Acidimicrobiales bacterium]
IISQGQIDAVLNARAEDRRLIIEEAAGVLKYRRRKEKAERRLTSTEANLTRLQDLLREVRRQLRPLEKQADAARRHGAVVAELTALRTYLAGQDIARLRGRLEQGSTAKADLAKAEGELRARLRDLDTEVIATEAQLSAMGGDDLGDALVRFESLRERARGLVAVLAERSRGIERDRGASVDQAVIASLEADAARLARELADVDEAAAELSPAGQELERAEADLELARREFDEEWAEGVETPSGAAAEVRGELAALRQSVERSAREVSQATSRLDGAEARRARLVAELEALEAELAERTEQGPALEAAAVAAAEALEAAGAALEAAEAERRRAEGAVAAWQARAEALALALDEARARAGAERLADVDGVLGTLLDVVEVDDGWEAALEAAAADAIAAVVVDSVEAGRAALRELRSGDASGAVLALGARSSGGTGSGGDLRRHVRGTRPGVDALLDALIGSVVVADDWTDGVDRALLDPGTVVVTRTGDRFGPSGWRVGAAGSGATGAALEEASSAAAQARTEAEAAVAAAAAARTSLDEARRAATEATRASEANADRLRVASSARGRAVDEQAAVETEVGQLRSQATELEDRARREADRAAELEARLPALEAEEAHLVDQGRAMAEARTRLDERAAAVARQRADLDVRAAGIDERRQFLQVRAAELDERLSRHALEREQAEGRRVELDRRAVATTRLQAYVGERLEVIEGELSGLRERRRRQSEATRAVSTRLDGLRKDRQEAERELTELRERVQRAELEEAEVRLRLETAVESLRRDLEIEPEAAMAAPAPELAENVTPVARVRELERDLRIMGPINPLALEEFQALQERHEFLQGQLDDVKSSRRDLSKVIKAIDAEIVSVFAAAFADVSQNYTDLFETLFPGGKGKLKLTDPEDLLNTGIELEARPSGKNVRKLSLLSGGERSLTALAYLFAVFRARPSPFYVMDEVEAALDDVNLHRFLDLVHEFREEAQLIIVSHQKRTMEAADCLYGVTMQPGGSSKVVSEKVSS